MLNPTKSLLFFDNSFYKKVTFFKDIIGPKQINASVSCLAGWVHQTSFVPEKNLTNAFLNNYSIFNINPKFLNVLRFKFYVILLLQSYSFLKVSNVFEGFGLFPLLRSAHKLAYLQPTLNFVFFSYNLNLLTWFDLNKQLFNSNFLTLTLKTTKRNVFLAVSSAAGSTLWKKSSGAVGFRGKYKKAPEALRKLTDSLILFLRGCNVPGSFIFRFFFVKSLDKSRFDAFSALLSRLEIYYTYIIYDVRHPHGYMRLRKQRRL